MVARYWLRSVSSQQLHQLIFPQAGDGVAAVAARFVAQRDDHRPTVRDALDLALKNSEFGRINQVVGGVDCQKRRRIFSRFGPGS